MCTISVYSLIYIFFFWGGGICFLKGESNPTASDGDFKQFFASRINRIGKILQKQLKIELNGCKLVQNYPKCLKQRQSLLM